MGVLATRALRFNEARITFIIVSTLIVHIITILLTITTAAQNEGALSYLSVRGLYFLVVVFAATIV